MIKVYSLGKGKDSFASLLKRYELLASKYRKIELVELFPKSLAKAADASSAKAASARAFSPYQKDFCILLDEKGKDICTNDFAKLLAKHTKINFFVGGAYGFDNDYKNTFTLKIKLSSLTLPHKLARCLLIEQIYRGLCINAGHPYHKE